MLTHPSSHRYIEGAVRTTTATLPDLKTEELDKTIESIITNRYYHIDESNNKRFDCVGCPVRVCHTLNRDETCGYIENPRIDLTGIEDDTSLVPYIITIPSSNLVSYDKRSRYAASEYLGNYYKNDEEFWLDSDSVDPEQCEDHPMVAGAAYTTESEISVTGTGLFTNVDTAFPAIFAKVGNDVLLFDPTLHWKDNTVENPMEDGGGLDVVDSGGYLECANAPRDPFNEGGCALYDPFYPSK